MYKSFEPGSDKDIIQRGIRNFEKQGYGLSKNEDFINNSHRINLDDFNKLPKNKFL